MSDQVKLSPTPWRTGDDDNEALSLDFIISDAEGNQIVFIDREAEEWEANGRLIVAAPETVAELRRVKALNAELLSALGDMLDAFAPQSADRFSQLHFHEQDATEAARAVIAKARGEEGESEDG